MRGPTRLKRSVALVLFPEARYVSPPLTTYGACPNIRRVVFVALARVSVAKVDLALHHRHIGEGLNAVERRRDERQVLSDLHFGAVVRRALRIRIEHDARARAAAWYTRSIGVVELLGEHAER